MNIRSFAGSNWFIGAAGAMILLIVGYKLFPVSAQAEKPSDATSTVAVAEATTPDANALPTATQAEAPLPGDTTDFNAIKPAQAQPVLPSDLSPGVAEIAKLVQSHVGDDVILAYIRKSTVLYKPTADEIVYLNDLGVSDTVLTELISRGKEGLAEAAPSTEPVVTAPAAPTAPSYSVAAEQPAAPAPAPAAPATVVAAPPAEPVTVQYFQSSLSPYGTWVYLDDYGWCWQPTVVVGNPGWRPYCDRGRWIYTDCGWYWESDYSWGWATFHYGRWWHHPHHGWVWYPDTVWGPSWVCWRHHDSYCGWAPLPPAARFTVGIGLTFHRDHVTPSFAFGLSEEHFTFVAYGHFRDHHPDRFRVPSHEVATIYRNSTVINNYTVINKTTVINEGVGRDRVSRITHEKIDPISVRHVSTPEAVGKLDRMDHATRTLSVYHPPAANFAGEKRESTPVRINRPVTPATSRTVTRTETDRAFTPRFNAQTAKSEEARATITRSTETATRQPRTINSSTVNRIESRETITSSVSGNASRGRTETPRSATTLPPTRETVAEPAKTEKPATPLPRVERTVAQPATAATPANPATPATPATPLPKTQSTVAQPARPAYPGETVRSGSSEWARPTTRSTDAVRPSVSSGASTPRTSTFTRPESTGTRTYTAPSQTPRQPAPATPPPSRPEGGRNERSR